jgi:murein DD-endopeptidase MepM/ murein hydrolase activator NlpD
VSAFADIFSWDIDFYLDPRKGDTIKILFEKEYLGSRFIQYGRILAAQYVGRQRTYSAFYYADEKQEGYYDETGLPLRKLFMRVPVKFGMRTSSFSTRRFHPVTKKYRRHTGIDYGAPRGTPILQQPVAWWNFLVGGAATASWSSCAIPTDTRPTTATATAL